MKPALIPGRELMFCPGCGIPALMIATVQVLDELGIRDKTVWVSGIGCTGRSATYVNLNAIHTQHGRAIPVAIGIKYTRPDLNVLVFSGEGDLISIGTNHLIHAARRNDNITVIEVNNFNFALTGSQASPTTLPELRTKTDKYVKQRPYDGVTLLSSFKDIYLARWTTAHLAQFRESVKKAIQFEGFAFIEVLSQCPTGVGRHSKMSAQDMVKWFAEKSIPSDKPEPITFERIPIGEWYL